MCILSKIFIYDFLYLDKISIRYISHQIIHFHVSNNISFGNETFSSDLLHILKQKGHNLKGNLKMFHWHVSIYCHFNNTFNCMCVIDVCVQKALYTIIQLNKSVDIKTYNELSYSYRFYYERKYSQSITFVFLCNSEEKMYLIYTW